MRSSFDVLVAGGGPAGSTLALDLSRRGLSVALIEQDNYQSVRIGETLPPMVRRQLAELGVWEQFLASGALESSGIQSAWESATPRHQDFIRNPYGCGWHVDRARFDAMLASAAAEAGATVVLAARVTSFRRQAGQLQTGGEWLVDASQHGSGLNFKCRMLVDATGRKALLASRLGSQADVADRLIGMVAFSEESETPPWTLIEAVEAGWWYSAPLPGARTVFAYMTDSDLWNDRAWADLLKSAPLTSKRARRRDLPLPSHTISAASVVRRPVTGLSWVAIGDAAFALDPLSGQGIFKSIDTGIRAAAAIVRYFEGDDGGMQEYEAWVRDEYRSYLSTRAQFYGSVSRWPDSQFWSRRSPGSGPLINADQR